MSETLKPCPHCGAQPKAAGFGKTIPGHRLIVCTGDTCAAEGAEMDWQRRAMPPEVAALLAKLEKGNLCNWVVDEIAAVKRYYNKEV